MKVDKVPFATIKIGNSKLIISPELSQYYETVKRDATERSRLLGIRDFIKGMFKNGAAEDGSVVCFKMIKTEQGDSIQILGGSSEELLEVLTPEPIPMALFIKNNIKKPIADYFNGKMKTIIEKNINGEPQIIKKLPDPLPPFSKPPRHISRRQAGFLAILNSQRSK